MDPLLLLALLAVIIGIIGMVIRFKTGKKS